MAELSFFGFPQLLEGVQGLDPSVVGQGGITLPVIGYAYYELTGPVTTNANGFVPVPGLSFTTDVAGLFMFWFSGTGRISAAGRVAEYGVFAGSPGPPPVDGSIRYVEHVEMTPFCCVGFKSLAAGAPVQARFSRDSGPGVTNTIENGNLLVLQVA